MNPWTRRAPLLVAIALLGTVPFLRTSDPNLWLDEIITYDVAVAPWGRHLELVYGVYDHPPLFFHLLWLVARLSTAPAFLSLIPALCVVAAGAVLARSLWRSGRAETRGQIVALFLGFFALSPVVCYQAWNLRHYGLLMLLGSCYLACWTAALRGGRRALGFSALFAGLGLITHHFMLFVLVAGELAGGLLLRRQAPGQWRRSLPTRALVFVPFAITWVLVAWSQYPGSGGEAVAKILQYRGFPALRLLWANFHGAPEMSDLPGWHAAAALVIGIVMMALDATLLRRRDPVDLLWGAVAYIPVGLVFALSYFKPCLANRFLAVSAVAMMGLHARAVVELGRSGWACGGLLAGVLASGLYFHVTLPPQYPPYATYIPQIIDTVGQDSVLVLPPGSQPLVYAYHAAQSGRALPPIVAIPIPVEGRPAYDAALAALPGRLQPYQRAWAVYELPRFWDPENGTQRLMESRWKAGPYQELWGKKWVITYYDNPSIPAHEPQDTRQE